MADVRTLLKAKREEKRISHPFAAYSQAGQLRCTACSIAIKHASTWDGHIGSKAHRKNAARLKEEKLIGAADMEKRQGKRKAEEEETIQVSKKSRVEENEQPPSAVGQSNYSTGFPSDFFSDPSRLISAQELDSDGSEGGNEDNPFSAAVSQPQSTLDLEWAKFQEAVVNAPVDADARETFERATVFAEPQLSTEIPEGFPTSVGSGSEPGPSAPPGQANEQAERRRREEDEKELIMDRLLDEERAQEEADNRVATLKAKFDLLKQKRITARGTKPKT